MKNFYLLFKKICESVLCLLLLAVLCVLLLFESVLLEENEFFLALVCGAGIVGSIWGGVCILKSQKTVVSGLMMLFFAGVVGVTFFYVAQSLPTDDENDCADMGVCSEKVISDKECLDAEGVWLTVGGERLCYLKWSTVRPVVLEAVRGAQPTVAAPRAVAN